MMVPTKTKHTFEITGEGRKEEEGAGGGVLEYEGESRRRLLLLPLFLSARLPVSTNTSGPAK